MLRISRWLLLAAILFVLCWANFALAAQPSSQKTRMEIRRRINMFPSSDGDRSLALAAQTRYVFTVYPIIIGADPNAMPVLFFSNDAQSFSALVVNNDRPVLPMGETPTCAHSARDDWILAAKVQTIRAADYENARCIDVRCRSDCLSTAARTEAPFGLLIALADRRDRAIVTRHLTSPDCERDTGDRLMV